MRKSPIKLSDHFSYKRLLRFSLPSIAMMVFTSVYSVVDGFFVSNFAGKTPFAAVNFIMPFLMVLATVGFMFGTGGSAIVAKLLGEGKKELANERFSLFVYVSFGAGAVIAVIAILFMRPIAALLGAEGEMLSAAAYYGKIVLIGLPFYVLQIFFQAFFVTAEKPRLGLAVTLSSGLANMLLDYLLVALLPAQWKLAGAAIATAVSQFVGGVIPIFYFFSRNSSLLRLGKTKWSWRALLKATANGSSEFMSNVSMSVVGILYNAQLLKYAGENGVAAYGVMMYVSFIFSSVFLGYSMGTAPVVSFHFGAENHSELRSLFLKSLAVIAVFGALMTGLAEAATYPLAKIFVGYDAELLRLTESGFRIFSLSFLAMGFAIFGSGFFTALNDGLTSALISFLRTLVFQVAAILLFPRFWGVRGIWMSVVAAELMAGILTAFFLLIKRRKFHYD